jgi:hypothetical protein
MTLACLQFSVNPGDLTKPGDLYCKCSLTASPEKPDFRRQLKPPKLSIPSKPLRVTKIR